jgi:hypothetical protein
VPVEAVEAVLAAETEKVSEQVPLLENQSVETAEREDAGRESRAAEGAVGNSDFERENLFA